MLKEASGGAVGGDRTRQRRFHGHTTKPAPFKKKKKKIALTPTFLLWNFSECGLVMCYCHVEVKLSGADTEIHIGL